MGDVMEANYRELCDFLFDRGGEVWTITGCWKVSCDNSIAWWDAEAVMDGIKFHRIFRPSEIQPPPIQQNA